MVRTPARTDKLISCVDPPWAGREDGEEFDVHKLTRDLFREMLASMSGGELTRYLELGAGDLLEFNGRICMDRNIGLPSTDHEMRLENLIEELCSAEDELDKRFQSRCARLYGGDTSKVGTARSFWPLSGGFWASPSWGFVTTIGGLLRAVAARHGRA